MHGGKKIYSSDIMVVACLHVALSESVFIVLDMHILCICRRQRICKNSHQKHWLCLLEQAITPILFLGRGTMTGWMFPSQTFLSLEEHQIQTQPLHLLGMRGLSISALWHWSWIVQVNTSRNKMPLPKKNKSCVRDITLSHTSQGWHKNNMWFWFKKLGKGASGSATLRRHGQLRAWQNMYLATLLWCVISEVLNQYCKVICKVSVLGDEKAQFLWGRGWNR